VLDGLATARYFGAKTIALVGFDGGRVVQENMADVIVHVNSDNYGIVEDSHMMILHSWVQKIRTDYSVRGKNLKL
jgi:phosphoheptose isomerase